MDDWESRMLSLGENDADESMRLVEDWKFSSIEDDSNVSDISDDDWCIWDDTGDDRMLSDCSGRALVAAVESISDSSGKIVDVDDMISDSPGRADE